VRFIYAKHTGANGEEEIFTDKRLAARAGYKNGDTNWAVIHVSDFNSEDDAIEAAKEECLIEPVDTRNRVPFAEQVTICILSGRLLVFEVILIYFFLYRMIGGKRDS